MENRVSPLPPGRLAGFVAWLDRLPPLQEKLVLIVMGTVYSAIGYFTLGLTTSPLRAASLMTPVDAAVPFVPAYIQAYVGVYTAAYYPAFVIRDRYLFRRLTQAYLLAMTVAFAMFAVFPVSGMGLRPSLAGYDVADFNIWCLTILYTYDPPYNLFPSLHLAIATIAVLGAWKAKPLYGWLALGPALAIALSIVLIKQHFIADGAAGILLAWACHRGFIYGWTPAKGAEAIVASSWRGPWGYLAYHVVFCLSFYLAFRAGWQPWQ